MIFRLPFLLLVATLLLPPEGADAGAIGRRCADARLAGHRGGGALVPRCTTDPRSGPREGPIRVLLFSRTTGFRHDSIATAHEVLGSLAGREGIEVTITEDPAAFTDDGLAGLDVLLFVNTTGDVLDGEQQAAMERFIRSGKGYVGVHSAADTEYGWPWYGRLVGAYFRSHPVLPVTVEVTAEDRSHATTSHLPDRFSFTDEIYNFDRNPRYDNAILLTVDEAGFLCPGPCPNTDGGPSMGPDHPIAWYKEFEGGRSFYTNLGHLPQTWSDPRFREHLLDGIRWAAEPAQYSRIVLTGEASNPLALEVAPDGRVFYVERTGEIRVWRPETGQVALAARLDVDTNFENGLLGLALDPDFARNGFVYLYHSAPVSDPPPPSGPPGRNTLSRFTLRADDTLDLASRVDLLEVPSERECCHEGGSLAFAPDGTLFLSVGDNTDPFGESGGYAPLDERPGRTRFDSRRTAQNPFDLRGSILRIHPDGSVPPGNLYAPDGSEGRPEIYVKGTRNPFRIAVDGETGRLFWGDVGPDAPTDSVRGPRGYDEVNFADAPGNYGWPLCIGFNRPYADWDYATQVAGPPFSCEGFAPALLAYDYFTVDYLTLGNALDPEGEDGSENPVPGVAGRTAIAGTFYRAPRGARFALPPPFRQKLLMTDWTRDIIASVDVDGAGQLRDLSRLVPWEKFERPIDLDVGPDGALYVLEFGSGYFGDNENARVSRLEYSPTGELTPVAAVTASTTAGAAPLTVDFSAAGSRAPARGDEIAEYLWDFDGNGTIDSSGQSGISYVYARPGVYSATLVVESTSGERSIPAVQRIFVGNAPPEVTILAPADGAVVSDGANVELRGAARDAEDGEAACADLLWTIRLGHNAHAHPLYTLQGCETTFVAEIGDHGAGSLFFAVELEYTDRGAAGGLPPLTGRDAITVQVR
jgi:glucose/arabinose dehydrogenase